MVVKQGVIDSTGVTFAAGQSMFDHIVTNYFKPVLADARNNATPFWSVLKKGMAKMDTSGRFIIWPVRTTRNRGRNAVREGGAIPDPGSQGFKTYATESRTYMARIKIDGATLDRAQTNGGAFADAVTLEMEGQIDDIMVDHGRMSHNDGSGRLAEVSVAAASTLTLRINQSIPGALSCSTKPTLYLEVGDRIGFYNPAGDALRVGSGGTTTAGQNGFYVQTIVSNTQITLSSTDDLATTVTLADITALTLADWVVRVSGEQVPNIKGTAARAEFIGLQGILSPDGVLDGNGSAGSQQSGGGGTPLTSTTVTGGLFQGLVADGTNPWNRAPVLTTGTSSTRPISELLLQQSVSDFEELNNGILTLLLMSYSTYNSYFALLAPDKRYSNTLTLEGGHSVLTFNGQPILKDRFVYGNRAIGVGMDEWMYHEVAELGPMAPFGIPRWERLNDTEAYWTGMRARGNIGVNVRQRAGFQLLDLSQ